MRTPRQPFVGDWALTMDTAPVTSLRSVAADRSMSRAPRPARAVRKDALRNRDAVIRAAVTLFSEQGPSVTMDQIATYAGVGKGTVYRGWATREMLMVDAALRQLGDFEQTVSDTLSADMPAEQAIVEFVHDLFQLRRRSRLIIGMFPEGPPPELLAARDSGRRLIHQLVVRGQAAGVVRPDVTGRDLSILQLGYISQLSIEPGARPKDWTTAAFTVLCAIGIPPERALPPRYATKAGKPAGRPSPR